ncbi:MAG TPA: S9 family peptidase [Chthonomonadaceae bacterium]|nr:S9 family peptidase [Chthonomonadaceae bacterium]
MENALPLKLTLEAIYQEKVFETTSLREPVWMQDGLRFSYLAEAPDPDSDVTTVWIYDVRTGERKPVVDAKKLKLPKGEGEAPPPEESDSGEDAATGETKQKPDVVPVSGYQWSPDETRLLIARKTTAHATVPGDKSLYVYTLATQKMERVAHAEEPHRNVKWAPDGKQIGYVRGDDIYVLDLATQKETRLTDTAAPLVYNGRFGWVYEEELDLVDGWAWSPDGRRIAYFQMDERPVPQVDLPNYDDLHIKPIPTRYPKAGDPNPLVKIGLVEVPSEPGAAVPPTRWVDLGLDSDIYVARMQWTPPGDLLLQRIPRLQNRIDLLKADSNTGKTTTVLSEEDKAWVDARGDLSFVGKTDQFLWPSDRDGYTHLYLYDLSGKRRGQVTSGEWDVDKVAGVDATHRVVYFTAARPSPLERQIFSVLLDGGGEIMQVSDTPGTHAPLFAPDCGHYLDTHSGHDTPPHTRLHRASGRALAVVHANPMPKLQPHKEMLGEWEPLTMTTGDGILLHLALLKPVDFDPNKKYPVLMFTYGGPGSQVVLDSYGSGSGLAQLFAQQGYLLAMVDGRGSGMRGRDFKKVTYLNLGHWEVHDQIEGAKWLGQLPYVDPKRIGIWGWSYGGYMASLCILRGADVFKVAAAVAPVTHWAFYDTIYTERYMRRPQDNPKGYEESAPITHAEKLKGRFLLVHGTADDNVHFQNSARLAEALQKQDKQFQTMFYPGKHHGLEGVSLHVFTLLTDFVKQNL